MYTRNQIPHIDLIVITNMGEFMSSMLKTYERQRDGYILISSTKGLMEPKINTKSLFAIVCRGIFRL